MSRAFPHLSEHRTSSQAFCRYVNCHIALQSQIVVDAVDNVDIYAGGSDTGHGFDQGFNSLVTVCRRGQHVWVRNLHDNGHTIYPGTYTTFSGFLLYEIEAAENNNGR